MIYREFAARLRLWARFPAFRYNGAVGAYMRLCARRLL